MFGCLLFVVFGCFGWLVGWLVGCVKHQHVTPWTMWLNAGPFSNIQLHRVPTCCTKTLRCERAQQVSQHLTWLHFTFYRLVGWLAGFVVVVVVVVALEALSPSNRDFCGDGSH